MVVLNLRTDIVEEKCRLRPAVGIAATFVALAETKYTVIYAFSCCARKFPGLSREETRDYAPLESRKTSGTQAEKKSWITPRCAPQDFRGSAERKTTNYAPLESRKLPGSSRAKIHGFTPRLSRRTSGTQAEQKTWITPRCVAEASEAQAETKIMDYAPLSHGTSGTQAEQKPRY